MKSLLSILSLVILVLGLVNCGGLRAGSLVPKPSIADLVKHEGSATIALVHNHYDNTDREVSDIRVFCSGVWIDSTHILTAGHCVKAEQDMLQEEQNAKETPSGDKECNPFAALLGLCQESQTDHVTIELKDMPIHFVQENEATGVSKEPSAWHVGKVTGWALDRDLALIEAVGNAVPVHEYATLASEDPAMMAPLTVVGHPKGLYWTYMTGSCAGLRDTLPHMSKNSEGNKRIGPFLQVEAPVYFGNSGGGAFNDRGELVGIASFLLRLPGEGFFVGRESMHAFLVDQKFYKQ